MTVRSLNRVLVANRGEIAVRIIKACDALGIESVLAFSEADRETMGAKMATKAVCIGPAVATQSYLRPQLIVHAAKVSGCDAVHPGYGFLAENAELARACAENDLIFVGPTPENLEQAGDKLLARKAAEAAGVSIVPGSEKTGSAEEATEIAARIGYPVVMKAAAGGGGRGMFIAEDPKALKESFGTASAEALAAFGDETLYMERFIANARHIEVQVAADNFGNAIHLGERDCSIQRRYQKVIEEGPASAVPMDVRQDLHAAALNLVRYLDYRNVGTVEFLYGPDTQEFFFIEMNARVQVEHPVSELISGVDIVAEQLNIAAGKPLSVSQDQVTISGHAIECRINAENPKENFRPSPGRLTTWKAPQGEGVRLDSHCYEGYLVPPFYDSMIAKLLVYGTDRADAIERMKVALNEFQIDGIATNIEFHKFVMNNEDYAAGTFSTRWLEQALLPAFEALED